MQNKLARSIVFIIILFIIVGVITFSFGNSNNSNSSVSSAIQSSTNTPTSPVSTVASTKTYSLIDVAKHKTANDCWTTINGNVYDLTSFVNSHPGGVENIISICGIDGSSAFGNQHGGQRRPASELVSLYIGKLK